ncbi:PREDICTED: uncharacterized protein LOC109339336, partial [Lupinus angustifolius]|uniref:uncharacterized protein LOC109339336 n=1 Tax=Lupinus angustifolius TaxID=3871 RepID=UPI00092EC72E
MEKIRMIRENMKIAQSRQKSYYDRKKTPLSFEEGDHVFMRVVPTTGIGRMLKTRQLTPRFIGPYQIIRKVGLLKNNLTFKTLPLRIVDQSLKTLGGKESVLVKMIWSQTNGEDATWE